MLDIYSNVEYNIPGDTYFGNEDGNSFVTYTEYDQKSDSYEIALLEEMDDEERVEAVDTMYFADTYDEAIGILESYKSNLDALVISDRVNRFSVLEAWEEL